MRIEGKGDGNRGPLQSLKFLVLNFEKKYEKPIEKNIFLIFVVVLFTVFLL